MVFNQIDCERCFYRFIVCRSQVKCQPSHYFFDKKKLNVPAQITCNIVQKEKIDQHYST